MTPPNCSNRMLRGTEFLGPYYHALFLAVGCVYKYPLPTLLMGFCSHTCEPAHVRTCSAQGPRGAIGPRPSRCYSGALNIAGMLVWDGTWARLRSQIFRGILRSITQTSRQLSTQLLSGDGAPGGGGKGAARSQSPRGRAQKTGASEDAGEMTGRVGEVSIFEPR